MYITAGTALPPYLPYPLFLLETSLPMTACALYALLLHRACLSQKNGWVDERGRVYIRYPVDELCRALKRGRTAVKSALSELETAGLLERQSQGRNKPNLLYVKLMKCEPGKASENRLHNSRISGEERAGKPAANKYNKKPYTERNTGRDYSYHGEDSL